MEKYVRRTSLLVAVTMLAAACGEPASDLTATSSETVDTTVAVPETTTTTVLITSSTIGGTTTSVDPGGVDPEELVELLESFGAEMDPEEQVELMELFGACVVRPNLIAGEAIDRPAEFPTVEDLVVWADGFINPGHRRAVITSYLGPKGDPVEVIAGGMMFDLAFGTMMTITYFDGVTVWDYGGGVREVSAPDVGFVTLGIDGEWTESGDDQWPALTPFRDQFDVQTMAAGVLAEGELVGYERIAGVDTIRVSYSDAEAGADVWVNADALVIRLIYDLGDPEDPATFSYTWNVETLDAKLSEPLPLRL